MKRCLKIMVSIKKNEDAVSPVMGTILMVAVAVILAAIIASYVFGSASNVQKTKVVASTAQLENTGSISIVYQGGQDDSSLSYITISAPNASATFYTSSADGTLKLCPSSGCNTVTDQKRPNIGAVMKLIPISPTSDWPTGQKHVVVTGTFNDGVNQIILDTFV